MTPSRYCLILGAATVAIAGIISAFNYAVDPYLVFDVKRSPGFNDLKPSVAVRERMMKAYQSERVSARTVVIGSSRPDMGIDPATRAWPVSAQPVYNLSLVGSALPEELEYLRHYVAMNLGRAPKTLVVGLDFESYLYAPSPVSPVASTTPHMSEAEERLDVDPSGNPTAQRSARVLKDRALSLLSLDALADSIQTVRGSRSANMTSLDMNGHMSEAGMRDTAHADGSALLFDQKNLETIQRFAEPHRVLSNTPDAPIRGFDVLKELLALAKSHDINVVLTIQPAHVSRLELLDRMGYWDDYERWKRALVAVSAQASTGQKVTLWDFGGYEQQAQEVVPVKGSGARDMQWFWDPVHYTSRLGDTMIASMFGTGKHSNFGVILTPDNVEAQLARIRRDREDFRTAMPEETARLTRLICATYPCRVPAKTLASAH